MNSWQLQVPALKYKLMEEETLLEMNSEICQFSLEHLTLSLTKSISKYLLMSFWFISWCVLSEYDLWISSKPSPWRTADGAHVSEYCSVVTLWDIGLIMKRSIMKMAKHVSVVRDASNAFTHDKRTENKYKCISVWPSYTEGTVEECIKMFNETRTDRLDLTWAWRSLWPTQSFFFFFTSRNRYTVPSS